MRNTARDVAVVVDEVVLCQFIIGFVPLALMGIFSRELDMIQNFDLLTQLHVHRTRMRKRLANFILFHNPCFQVFVSLRPDVFSATVRGNKEAILKEAGIENASITLVYIACEGDCIHLLCDVIHCEMMKEQSCHWECQQSWSSECGSGEKTKSKM
jgi:hypothetical protein